MRDPIPFRGGIRDGGELSSFEIPAAVVTKIARISAMGLGLEELLGETCREIVSLCSVDACYLVSFRGRDGATEVRHYTGSRDWPDLRAVYGPDPRWDAALAHLCAHGILATGDISSLSPDDPVRALHEPHSVRSLLLAPLKFGTGLVGLLALHGYGSPRDFGQEGLRIVGAVASILSAALERRRMEERLRSSEARYRFLADTALDVISLHDATGRYLYASPAAQRMLGFRPEEMVGCGGEAFLPPEDRERVREATRRLASGEVTARIHHLGLSSLRASGIVQSGTRSVRIQCGRGGCGRDYGRHNHDGDCHECEPEGSRRLRHGLPSSERLAWSSTTRSCQ